MSGPDYRIVLWTLLGILFLIGAVKELVDQLHTKNTAAPRQVDHTPADQEHRHRSGIDDLHLIAYACLAWTAILFIRHWTSGTSLDYALPAASGFVVAQLSSLLPARLRDGWIPIVLTVAFGAASAFLIA
ncbi:hypothetical protein [uncultured Bifidobacterium sp.]|uniref:hypothetical protein n=1 Tax=uncultured Bifidobacterium sp. TaxID=165187 RepID=UPI002619B954|nr:hypothetical protein [uncultured Bifidobacterium sp.]